MTEDGKTPIRYSGRTCPLPIQDYPRILMAHGGGGQLMRDLIEKLFLAAFGNDHNRLLRDGTVLPVFDRPLVITTDSYVVSPLFFPGGDIGSLAVHGTVNDLAVSGARPEYLTAGFILEEGLSMETLWNTVQAMADAAVKAGVQIVTGDTKVVEHGKADGLYINTAGVGQLIATPPPGPDRIAAGDVIIVSGDIGRHGIAIMGARGELGFELDLASDSAPVNGPIGALFDAGIPVHCMRDLTRGGLATALIELAESAGQDMRIFEDRIPIRDDVNAACEVLGLDPLFVANEGRFVGIIPAEHGETACEIINNHQTDAHATIIGTVLPDLNGRLVLQSVLGTERILFLLSGEQLPRIC